MAAADLAHPPSQLQRLASDAKRTLTHQGTAADCAPLQRRATAAAAGATRAVPTERREILLLTLNARGDGGPRCICGVECCGSRGRGMRRRATLKLREWNEEARRLHSGAHLVPLLSPVVVCRFARSSSPWRMQTYSKQTFSRQPNSHVSGKHRTNASERSTRALPRVRGDADSPPRVFVVVV